MSTRALDRAPHERDATARAGDRPADAQDAAIPYRPDIDGLRAVAVLAVIAYHAFPLTFRGGFVGVDVFFVISGYLITGILLRSLQQQRFSLLRFYGHRVRRIFPALCLVLASCLAAGWLLLWTGEYAALGKHVAGGAGFVSNLLYWQEAGYFDRNYSTKPLLHLWSLGIEEQYYLLWPLLLAFAWRHRARAAPWLVALLAVSLGLNLGLIDPAPVSTFYLLHTRFWELMTGSLLAWWSLSPREGDGSAAARERWAWLHQPATRQAAGAIGIMLLVLAFWRTDSFDPFPGWRAVPPALGAALLIHAGPAAAVNRLLLASRPLVWIGLLSYPWYLWHWPLLSFARIVGPYPVPPALRVLLLLASLLLAWLTWRLVERPIRARAATRVAPALLATCLGLGAAGLAVWADGGLDDRPIVRAHAAAAQLLAQSRRDDAAIRQRLAPQPCTDARIAPAVRAACAQYGADGGETIVVWGDSHAAAWIHPFAQLATERRLRVILFERRGCLPVFGLRRIDAIGKLPDSCPSHDTAREVVDAIAALQPARTFVIARWAFYERLGKFDLLHDDGRIEVRPTAASLRRALLDTVLRLAAIGPVTLFRSMPELLDEIDRGLLRGVPLEPTLEAHRRQQAPWDRVLDEAKRRNPSIAIFDPAESTCAERCAAMRGGLLLYVDDNHVSAAGALRLKDALARHEPVFGGSR